MYPSIYIEPVVTLSRATMGEMAVIMYYTQPLLRDLLRIATWDGSVLKKSDFVGIQYRHLGGSV